MKPLKGGTFSIRESMAASNCRTFSPVANFWPPASSPFRAITLPWISSSRGTREAGAFRLATPRADVNSSRVPSSSKIGLFLGIFIRVMVLARPPSPFFV